MCIVDASKLKFIFFVFFCVCIVDASKLKFIFFVFNVICKFKITSFLCVCVLLLPFKLKFIFLKVKLMVYYLKIDRLL